MNVLMISPGFPQEQPFFTQGLARQGASVVGLGDQPQDALPERAKNALAAYLQVSSFTDSRQIMAQVAEFAHHHRIDRVECTWEPFMTLAAQLREMLRVPGMTVEQTLPFRDKEIMKQKLDAHGIRTPKHASSKTAHGVRASVSQIGFPVCIKPIAGAGSADTYRVDNARELDQIIPRLGHVTEVSVEEFIEGTDYTFDTVCVDGEIKFFNIAMYRPRALIGRQEEWISQQTVVIRDVDDPILAAGRRMGEAVNKALGFKTGFTHMEWFLKPDGEAVFGEIGARPPGAGLVDLMNFANDIDLFGGWAEAVVHGRFSAAVQRKYNCAHIYKRAQGQGCIQNITGLAGLMADYGPHICAIDLLPIGAPRRNWKQSLRSDGMVIVRHPDFATTCEIADQVGIRLQIFAG
jgi:formate-dependent phosphoribosylglycinamide formyltransferase (GAR transformylase)